MKQQRNPQKRNPWKHWLVIIGATTAGTLCATSLDRRQSNDASPAVVRDYSIGEEAVRIANANSGQLIKETP